MDKLKVLDFPDKDRAHECLRTVYEASYNGDLDWHYQDTYLVFMFNYYADFEGQDEVDEFLLYSILLKINELRNALDAYWNLTDET